MTTAEADAMKSTKGLMTISSRGREATAQPSPRLYRAQGAGDVVRATKRVAHLALHPNLISDGRRYRKCAKRQPAEPAPSLPRR